MRWLDSEGGIWPPFNTGTADVARAVLAAAPHVPGDPLGLSDQTVSTTGSDARTLLCDEDVTIYTPTAPKTAQQWNFLSSHKTADEYANGRVLHPTIRASRDTAHVEAGRDSAALWSAMEFFPLWASFRVVPPWGEDPPDGWDPREDYAWAVRHVFTPLGASTFMEFHDTRDVWGSLPDSPEIFRLPDDFTTVESDAWSLFDRPAPTPEDPR